MKTIRKLLAWQAKQNPPTVDDVRQGRAHFTGKGQPLEAVLMRPEDAKAIGTTNVDSLVIVPDGTVTPGCCFFVVAE